MAEDHRVIQLDGWRGVSISLVLAAHLLPLGPSRFQLNLAAGYMGMSLFFALSGYLITTFLLRRPDVKSFLIRRLFRIVPLAWLVLVLLLPFSTLSLGTLAPSFFFYQNYEFSAITPYNGHFWSLCVEMHFYVGVALLVAAGGRRALWALPLAMLAITAYRFYAGAGATIETHRRIDEILAGATLALMCGESSRNFLLTLLRAVSPWLGPLLLVATSLPQTGPLNYLRPYAAALTVGTTLMQPEHWLSRRLGSPILRYVATVSYAVYVFHGPLRAGWFGEGSTAVKYLIKRPITLVLTFALAHLSTFYWEARWIALAKRLTTRSKKSSDLTTSAPSADSATAPGP
jgi:peptidoglycan/LPS O-acetylase OafA/YrhL